MQRKNHKEFVWRDYTVCSDVIENPNFAEANTEFPSFYEPFDVPSSTKRYYICPLAMFKFYPNAAQKNFLHSMPFTGSSSKPPLQACTTRSAKAFLVTRESFTNCRKCCKSSTSISNCRSRISSILQQKSLHGNKRLLRPSENLCW